MEGRTCIEDIHLVLAQQGANFEGVFTKYLGDGTVWREGIAIGLAGRSVGGTKTAEIGDVDARCFTKGIALNPDCLRGIGSVACGCTLLDPAIETKANIHHGCRIDRDGTACNTLPTLIAVTPERRRKDRIVECK